MLDSDAHIGAPADSPESSTPAPRRRRRSASRPAGPPKAIEPTPAPAEIAPTPEPESVEAEWSEVPVDAPVVESAPEPVAEEVDARADQMTEQHRMQAAMNSEARAELAQLRESRKPLPVDFKGAEGINARLHYRRGWNAAQAAHGIGEKTP